MSHTVPIDPERSPPDETLVQEEDRVPVLPTVLMILAALALIGLGVAWPWWILARTEAPTPHPVLGSAPQVTAPQPRLAGGQPRTDRVGKAVDGASGETAFAPPSLDRFEWVDRTQGLIDLPVDVAEELWLERQAGDDRAGAAARASSTPGRRGAP